MPPLSPVFESRPPRAVIGVMVGRVVGGPNTEDGAIFWRCRSDRADNRAEGSSSTIILLTLIEASFLSG